MPLHKLTEDELRGHCKRHLENLEKWLRRFIDEELSRAYGRDYFTVTDSTGKFLLPEGVVKGVLRYHSRAPEKYPRLIDYSDFGHLVSIVSDRSFYTSCFSAGLDEAFPLGHAEVRIFLDRLTPVRNLLAHANPISVRQAERAICYANDVVESLKSYYRGLGMERQYNAPSFIRITDSFGATFADGQLVRYKSQLRTIRRTKDEKALLRPGDTLAVEVELDASFDPENCHISWTFGGLSTGAVGPKIVVPIENMHVSASGISLVGTVRLLGASWHRFGDYDDRVRIRYLVLPPE